MNKGPTSTSGGKSVSQKIIPATLLAVIVVVGLAILFWPKAPETKPAVKLKETNAPAVAPQQGEASFKPLLGNWLREDGGYRLELKSVASDGRITAAYLNPSPINVSFASATNETGTLKIRVELTDVGYPGCVYSLVLDRMNDRLIGTYFQAAMGETYEVMFVRVQ